MQIGEWEGRVGRKWAEEWRRTDRSFTGLTEQLLARARSAPFDRALDVGCGAGEVSLALARTQSQSQIRGVDVSEDLIEVARERGSQLDNVKFDLADAASWSETGFAPDLLVSRHGVMFFADPMSAFSHLREIAAPEARLIFSCFRAMSENSWASGITALLPDDTVEQPAPMVPGPFAFADRELTTSMLRDAGWRDIEFEPVDFAYIAGAGDDPVADALSYFLAIGPAARAAADLGPEAREAFVLRLGQFLEQHRSGSLVALGASVWLVTAKAP